MRSALLLCVTMASCGSSENALVRGDRYWADSNYSAALAEYRLAARQNGNDAQVAGRVAHAYVVTGQLDRARREYEVLLKTDPGYADQAVFDFLWSARLSMERGDRFGTARAAEAALALRPGLDLNELAIPLARHYASTGDVERALEFYNRALGRAANQGSSALLFELASLIEQNGKCIDAIPYFRSFTQQSASRDSTTEARWRMGSCGLERGKQARAAGEAGRAVELFEITLDVGAPPHLLDQTWLERGEALLSLGRVEQARASFERVLELSPHGRTQYHARAQRRLQEMLAVP